MMGGHQKAQISPYRPVKAVRGRDPPETSVDSQEGALAHHVLGSGDHEGFHICHTELINLIWSASGNVDEALMLAKYAELNG